MSTRQFVVFSKMFKNKTFEELADLALDYGFEGYDLCIRPGYQVTPDNPVVEPILAAMDKAWLTGQRFSPNLCVSNLKVHCLSTASLKLNKTSL